MGLPEVRAEIKILRDQYAAGGDDALDARRELAENVLPLLDLLAEAIAKDHDELRDEVGDLGEAVDDMIDDTGDVLTPETTTKIASVLEAGKMLCKELVALLPKADDVGKKRIAALVKAYRTGTEVVLGILTEITVPVEPEDEGQAAQGEPESDEEDEEDDEGEDDDDDLEDGDDETDGTITGGV